MAAALLGGICLVAHLFADAATLMGAGLALLAVAAALVGAGIVRQPWLAVITAGGSVALGWAVLEVARELAPDREAEAVLGGLASLCVAIGVMRRPPRRGNHRS